MNVFISYSRRDAGVAQAIAKHLVSQGHQAFIDYLGIRAGQEFVEVIGASIDSSDAVIVLLSNAAIESQWVRWEIGWALRQQKQIVPILLESIRWASIFPLANLHYLDFRYFADSDSATALEELNAVLVRMSPQVVSDPGFTNAYPIPDNGKGQDRDLLGVPA